MFHLTIVTSEQTVYEGDVQMLIASAIDGEIGILTNHHPIVTKLNPGSMRVVKPDQSEEILFVSGGFLQMTNNKATVLADLVENLDAIQLEEARAARIRAQELMKNAKSDVELDKLEKELQIQLMRERLATAGQFSRKKGASRLTEFENGQS